MVTNYDPIAEQYKLSKQQPWRTYIESHTLLELVGDPAGKRVVDLACGEGFYSRLVRQRGAAQVLGIDLSAGMIELARRQEAEHQLGIEYQVGDAKDTTALGDCDLVIAAYLLNYARDRAELAAMCRGVASHLRPGGRFVTVNGNPALDWPLAPSYRSYGFETALPGGFAEGAPITWTFYLEGQTFSIENYYLDVPIHEAALRAAGFREIHWHRPRLSPAGIEQRGADFWASFMEQPPVTFIECVK